MKGAVGQRLQQRSTTATYYGLNLVSSFYYCRAGSMRKIPFPPQIDVDAMRHAASCGGGRAALQHAAAGSAVAAVHQGPSLPIPNNRPFLLIPLFTLQVWRLQNESRWMCCLRMHACMRTCVCTCTYGLNGQLNQRPLPVVKFQAYIRTLHRERGSIMAPLFAVLWCYPFSNPCNISRRWPLPTPVLRLAF